MEQFEGWSLWWVRIGCVLIVLMIGLLATFLYVADLSYQRTRMRLDAEDRWATRPFVSYRMAVQDEMCYSDVAVRGDGGVWSFENSCGRGHVRTVESLFKLITRDQDNESYCNGQGCICATFTSVQAQYDEALGYPTSVVVHVEIVPNWRHADYWRRMWITRMLPRCTGSGGRSIMVLSVTPLR